MTEFQKFLVQEMEKRNLSQNGFATLLGMSSASMSNHMKLDGTAPTPSLEMLISLKEKTGTNFLTLLKLAYPTLPPDFFVDMKPSVRLIAERIAKLPLHQQEVIDSLIISLSKSEQSA